MATYTVQPGDNLSGIAVRFNTSIDWLQANNSFIVDPDHIEAGWVLTVPDTDGASNEPILIIPGNEQVITVIDDHLNGQGRVILEEARSASLELALACALVEQESEGKNIFGCDLGNVGDQPPYCRQEVTRGRLDALLAHIDADGDSNGVGLTQLTYPPFIRQAEALGGAHLPRNQCRVGFRLLEDLLDKFVYKEALAAYNGGEGAGRHLPQAIAYANLLAGRHDTWKARLGALPDTPGGVERVTEYKEVTLRVGDPSWPTYLYRENTDPKEWARTPDLKNAKLATNARGWVYAEETVPPEAESLEERIRKVTEYNLALAAAGATYSFWQDGECINWDGPPAFGVDGPPPAAATVTTIFCAGVGNLNLRLIGKPVPRNATTSCYDGGTKAWNDTYDAVMIDFVDPGNFDLSQAEEGDVLYRPWMFGGASDQGHWVYVGPDQGSGHICIQSFPWYPRGEHGGMNATYTIEESHDGGFYVKLLKAKDWLGD